MGDSYHARRVDVDTPSAPRVYDYMLGGQHHYQVDEVFASRILTIFPELRLLAHQNRQFLRDSVTFLSEQGVRQFIDIGSGIPTSPNVHEVARKINPDATVVYVDNQVEAVVTTREILGSDEAAAVIEANLCDPSTVLDHPETVRLIDFTKPVALLVVSVLHFVLDKDNPHEHVQTYMGHLVNGSYLAISHFALDEAAVMWQDKAKAIEQAYGDTSNPGMLRSREQVQRFFTGLEMAGLGMTYAANWKTGGSVGPDDPARCFYAGVGRKP